MEVIVLVFAFIMLLSNLKGYKNLFVGNDHAQKQLDKAFEESKKLGGKDVVKGTMVLITIFFTLMIISFNLMVATIVSQLVVTVWAAIIVLLALKGMFSTLNAISSEKVGKVSRTRFITTPVNTIYICYFIYFVLFVN